MIQEVNLNSVMSKFVSRELYGSADVIVEQLNTSRSYLATELEMTLTNYCNKYKGIFMPSILDITWNFVSPLLYELLEERGHLVMAEFGGMFIWGEWGRLPSPLHYFLFSKRVKLLEPFTLYKHSGGSCTHPTVENGDYFKYNSATLEFCRYTNLTEFEALQINSL